MATRLPDVFVQAIQAGDAARLRQLAQAGFDVRSLGEEAIRMAIDWDRVGLIPILHELGAPLPAEMTVYLVNRQNPELVRALIRAGARILPQHEHYYMRNVPALLDIYAEEGYPFTGASPDWLLREASYNSRVAATRALVWQYPYTKEDLIDALVIALRGIDTNRAQYQIVGALIEAGAPVSPARVQRLPGGEWFILRHTRPGAVSALRSQIVGGLGATLPGALVRYVLRAV